MIKYGRAPFIISVVGQGGGARGQPDEMKLAQFPFVGPILRMSSGTFIRIRNEREETRRVIRRRGRARTVDSRDSASSRSRVELFSSRDGAERGSCIRIWRYRQSSLHIKAGYLFGNMKWGSDSEPRVIDWGRLTVASPGTHENGTRESILERQ